MTRQNQICLIKQLTTRYRGIQRREYSKTVGRRLSVICKRLTRHIFQQVVCSGSLDVHVQYCANVCFTAYLGNPWKRYILLLVCLFENLNMENKENNRVTVNSIALQGPIYQTFVIGMHFLLIQTKILYPDYSI